MYPPKLHRTPFHVLVGLFFKALVIPARHGRRAVTK